MIEKIAIKLTNKIDGFLGMFKKEFKKTMKEGQSTGLGFEGGCGNNTPFEIYNFGFPRKQEHKSYINVGEIETCNNIKCSLMDVGNVKMTHEAYSQILNYARVSSSEFYSIMVGNNGTVTRVILPRQTATGTNCNLSAIEASGIKFRKGEEFMGWAHSHVNMSVFLSGDDMENIKTLLVAHKSIYSVVVNRYGDIKCWISKRLPCGEDVTTEVPVRVLLEPNTIYLEKCQKDIKDNVKSPIVKVFSKKKKSKKKVVK